MGVRGGRWPRKCSHPSMVMHEPEAPAMDAGSRGSATDAPVKDEFTDISLVGDAKPTPSSGSSSPRSAKYAVRATSKDQEHSENAELPRARGHTKSSLVTSPRLKQPDSPRASDGEGSGMENMCFEVVKKSVYKDKAAGKTLLQRLRGVAGSGTKQKYMLAARDAQVMAMVSPPSATDASNRSVREEDVSCSESESERTSVEITMEEEEPIQVAVEGGDAAPHRRGNNDTAHALSNGQQQEPQRRDTDMPGPQVVIHSADIESDSSVGFATLNPVVGRKGQTKQPISPAAAAAVPSLQEIPLAQQSSSNQTSKWTIVINALGASGLAKPEKFGTQSSLLEMKLCELADDQPSSGSIMRTVLHKKGGSEAHWNQQFTASLRSKEKQFLHISVKTDSKILIGEARVLLHEVSDLFYDQFYTLRRSIKNVEEGATESCGHVHLQLKITEASKMAMTMVVPPLQLPFPSATPPAVKAIPSVDVVVPAMLKNGGLLFKIPYHQHSLASAAPKRQWVTVHRRQTDGSCIITWCDPGESDEKQHFMELRSVVEVREGHGTKAFEKQLHSHPGIVGEKAKCFSLISSTRTLDLVASSKEEAHVWVTALRQLLFPVDNGLNGDAQSSARVMNNYMMSALSPRDNGPPNKTRIASWRNEIFHYARKRMLDEISNCLEDGCPVDLLETGSGDTLLMIACRGGDPELVELCLMWRAKNDPHPEFGETALQVAVNNGHSKCVELLLTTAAKSDMDSEIVNHIDSNNDAPLHVAARRGDLPCLQLLLHHGADICVVEEFGRTPLHCAVGAGYYDCVAYLLDVGGDSVLNAGDHDGDTSLHYAALAGNESIVRLLVESAADVFATNVHGETAYDIAVREKRSKCVELMAQYYLTGAREESPSPASRNEPASALLLKQQELEVEEDQCVNREKESEDEQITLLPLRSSVPATVDRWAEDEEGSPLQNSPPASYLDRNAAHSRSGPVPLSPSAQIREALSRSQRNLFGPSSNSVRTDPHMIHSARSEVQSHPVDYDRRPHTARIDRDHVRDDHRLQHYEHAHPMSARHIHQDGHVDEWGVPHAAWLRHRSQSAMSIGSIDAHGAGDGSRSMFSRRSNSADMTPPMRIPQQHMQGRSPPDPPPRAPAVVEWDTFYTEDGYPYYVHRFTGVSQWENPFPPAHVPPPPAMSAFSAETLSADSVVRMRLAEARKAKPTSHGGLTSPTKRLPDGFGVANHMGYSAGQYRASQFVSHASVPAWIEQPVHPVQARLMPYPAPRSPTSSSNEQFLHSAPRVAQPTDPRMNQAPPLSFHSSHASGNHLHTSGSTNMSISPRSTEQSPAKSVNATAILDEPQHPTSEHEAPSSRYQAKTGMKLTIDTTATPEKDGKSQIFRTYCLMNAETETRPVYIPSPRNRSPQAKAQPTEETEGSFQKSRPSSPRGRSKSIQMMELKRANNLAIALSNFKICDNYDPIIQAIASMDEKLVRPELLSCLQRFFPTEEEAQMLRKFSGSIGSLGKAERFLYQLLQVADIQLRIDVFLFKLEFPKSHRSLQTRIQTVKRACRDLVENFSFVQALDQFFTEWKPKSLHTFQSNRDVFRKTFLRELDQKLSSFRTDIEKAANVDLMELQMLLNRMVTGLRKAQTFGDRSNPNNKAAEPHEIAAQDITQRFLCENRSTVNDLESEFEAMGLWEDKLLATFGESRATSQLQDVLTTILELLPAK
ncbi:TPA: hypothetical protein N0F65_002259 [Lagenidium giganteum]|uniref:Uncharacterized protein n=1 Tax=Lagenidium giganteum TaxID=4803 RepID=A0AAV2YKW9_9STRA|nr:TPA: hypothetical protein N0F65_002259 [Lagenidium giganteum]